MNFSELEHDAIYITLISFKEQAQLHLKVYSESFESHEIIIWSFIVKQKQNFIHTLILILNLFRLS